MFLSVMLIVLAPCYCCAPTYATMHSGPNAQPAGCQAVVGYLVIMWRTQPLASAGGVTIILTYWLATLHTLHDLAQPSSSTGSWPTMQS